VAIVDGSRRVVLPDELSVRDALLFAHHGAPARRGATRGGGEGEGAWGKRRQPQVQAVYLDRYHVPRAWRLVGAVRYGAAGLLASLGATAPRYPVGNIDMAPHGPRLPASSVRRCCDQTGVGKTASAQTPRPAGSTE
jgi:hypothetical protein